MAVSVLIGYKDEEGEYQIHSVVSRGGLAVEELEGFHPNLSTHFHDARHVR